MSDQLKKIPLIVIAGPTASGKTKLAVEIAKKYDGEVISADSMQIYKEMNIASAKPTVDEMQGIPHHLIDILEPDYTFSVAEYVKMAKDVIMDVYSRKKTPIICGGTGLYISSLIDNVKFDDTGNDNAIRNKLQREAEQFGNHYLWEKLNEIDPETAANVHENNLPRVIRGIEVFELTGIKLSEHKINSRKESTPYNPCIIGLTFSDRALLYDRINKRVDSMIVNGLVSEAKYMYENCKTATSRQAIGYKELIPYFENTCTLDSCVEKIKQETRHYAKRQLTWFRRIDGIQWVEVDKFDEYKNFIEKVENIIAKTEIL
ncbi:MAG: tRNA (adenosine(37)-N6)-dimethylallyltransferase MiaA [Ruminococcus sp.]|nr:tRNA (adenosine(37)-N6)-dimethylallyltransferase MiaA [Ruminococcus sp.]